MNKVYMNKICLCPR